MLKQKDESKSHLWMEELRRALARLSMTIHTTDENVASLSLPWYAGRRDERGRLESEVANSSKARFRGRSNYADPAFWEAHWENFFQKHGYYSELTEDVNVEFDVVWPQVETFLVEREEQERRLRARERSEAGDAQEAASLKDERDQAPPEKSQRSVLILGCGLSSTPVSIYQKGFRQITCIDVASRVVLNLTERYKKYPGIEVLEVDARNLDRFATASFDLCIDKGLIDALFSGWNGFRDVDLVNENVCRVLKPGGCFVSICCTPPSLRSAHFLESSTAGTKNQYHPWDLRTAKGPEGAGDAGGLYVYIMTRLDEAESDEPATDGGGSDGGGDGKLSGAEAKLLGAAKRGTRTLRQQAYLTGSSGGYVDLQVVRDPMVLQVGDRAPRVEQQPPTPTMEEFLATSRTPEEAAVAQKLRKQEIENGTSLGNQGGGALIASEVGYAKKADSRRRGQTDNAAMKGGDEAGPGYKSEAFLQAQAAQSRLRKRAFSLEPAQELARETVRQLAHKKAPGGGQHDPPTDVNGLIADLVRGQAELARLRLERPPQALEPQGDAVPVSIVEHEQQERAREDTELRAHRAKLGLDENDLTRPPEKWTPAMLSFVEYTAYGPRPEEEDDKFKTLDDPAVLEVLCASIVSDLACEKELQQWCDGKNKVYKFFLSRALEATESKVYSDFRLIECWITPIDWLVN